MNDFHPYSPLEYGRMPEAGPDKSFNRIFRSAWRTVGGNTYETDLPDELFVPGMYNPYELRLEADEIVRPGTDLPIKDGLYVEEEA